MSTLGFEIDYFGGSVKIFLLSVDFAKDPQITFAVFLMMNGQKLKGIASIKILQNLA